MANISKIKRDELLSKINDIKDYISSCVRNERTEELIKYLNDIKLEIDGKKYGLIFEEHRENTDELLDNNVPVFCEEKEMKIPNINGKYNFLLEGDNLPSLELLLKTHKKRIDVIWGAPQQAFLRAPGHAKIAGVGTPALLAETCIPATWHEKTELHAFLTHPPFSGPFSVPPLWLQ